MTSHVSCSSFPKFTNHSQPSFLFFFPFITYYQIFVNNTMVMSSKHQRTNSTSISKGLDLVCVLGTTSGKIIQTQKRKWKPNSPKPTSFLLKICIITSIQFHLRYGSTLQACCSIITPFPSPHRPIYIYSQHTTQKQKFQKNRSSRKSWQMYRIVPYGVCFQRRTPR